MSHPHRARLNCAQCQGSLAHLACIRQHFHADASTSRLPFSEWNERKQPKATYTRIHMSIWNDVGEFTCIQRIHMPCATYSYVHCTTLRYYSHIFITLLFISGKFSPNSFHYKLFYDYYSFEREQQKKRMRVKHLMAFASSRFDMKTSPSNRNAKIKCLWLTWWMRKIK